MELKRRAGGVVTAAAVVAIVLGLLWWLDRPAPLEELPPPQETVAGSALSPTCDATRPFRPVEAVVADVTARVVPLPRDGNNVPGVPPLTVAGKGVVAWDQPPGVLPGSRRGNVLLNTHTWPDGSALGNRLLERLDVGDVVELRGKRGQRLCYRVTERVEVLAAKGFARYYEDTGKPQAALIVCSGERLGPDNWTHRTIWFASPVSSPVSSPGATGA